ncbi:hypothetical protein ACWGM0_15085 [Sphingomonas bisphenolicum]
MKLTVEQLSTLKRGQKLWLHDNQKGALSPKPAVLKVWTDRYRFYLHVLDETGKFVDAFNWSLNTNAPLGEARMPINQKIWLTLRD